MSGGPGPDGADLRHVEAWLFDLDNTLYPLESGVAARASARITDYVARLTGLPREAAQALQKRYLAEHGLTLRGLMTHHGVDPDEYHAAIADPDLSGLLPDHTLKAALERLPGRRIVFTNADAGHAERVLRALGLASAFDAVFHIASAGFAPKPSAEAFDRLVQAHGVDARAAAFFEDSERNLEPAAALGMSTVLVGPHAEACAAAFVHFRTPSLAPFLAAAQVRESR